MPTMICWQKNHSNISPLEYLWAYIQSNNSPPRQFHATFNKCIIAGNKGKLTDTITRLERWVVVEMSTFIRSLQSSTFLPEVVSGRRVSETVFPTPLQTVGSSKWVCWAFSDIEPSICFNWTLSIAVDKILHPSSCRSVEQSTLCWLGV